MNLTEAVEFKILWELEERETRKAILNFWNGLNALPNTIDPEERLKEVVYVALMDNQVIGVTTAAMVRMKRLANNLFYNYRVLVHPKFRIPGLVDKLGVLTIAHFERLFAKGETSCIGMITLIENEAYKSNRREAIWPSTGFVYIGDSSAGHPIRVRYFDKAKV